MTKFQGFFSLSKPSDLLEKLRHDLLRIREDMTDSYAAFDFFVTAEHLLDWKYPDSGGEATIQRRTQLRKTEPLLRVISNLANGAKHFRVKPSRHHSVDSVHKHNGIFDPAYFDPAYFDTDRLVIELIGDDAMAFGSQITVLTLSEKVVHYWEANIERL